MKITEFTPESQSLAELGGRLARVRKQQGYTQERLAEAAGIGVATLRRIEDGQDSQLSSWLKLLKVLQMTAAVDALMPEDFRSPMAEVLGAGGKRKAALKAARNAAGVSEVAPVWKDEAGTA